MRVLLVEDDADLSRQLKGALADAGYAVDHAADGEEAWFLGDTEPYDVIVLDLGLPKIDGVSVLERWRREGKATPVLILTARGAWSDKVSGFDAGADDYLTKPFHTEELLARLRALLRRSAGIASATLSCGGLRLDPRAARANVNGEPLRLTSLEYRLLHYMMMHQGRVISRTELVEHLYDQDFDRDSNTIEAFIGRLRKKIGSDRIELFTHSKRPAASLLTFREAFIRNKKRLQLYSEDISDIKVVRGRLFRSNIPFPVNVPIGEYLVTVHLFKKGEHVSSEETPLTVHKVGLEAKIFNFAHNQAPWYGAIAILIALVAGWLAGVIFRRA